MILYGYSIVVERSSVDDRRTHMIEGHFSPPKELRRLDTGRREVGNRTIPRAQRRDRAPRSHAAVPLQRTRKTVHQFFGAARVGVRREDREPGRTEIPQHIRSPAFFTTHLEDLQEGIVPHDLARDLLARVFPARPDANLTGGIRLDRDARKRLVLTHRPRPQMPR